MKCPGCGRECAENAAFCPFCGGKLAAGELDALLRAADDAEDFERKRELLNEAKSHFPDSLEVEKKLLFLGRLGEKGGKPDFYRIPFWPLSALDKPGEFSRRKRREMLSRFLNDPEYLRVKEKMPDKEAFAREYFGYMAEKYLEWFVRDTKSVSGLFFFRRSARDKTAICRERAGMMLKNLKNTDDVPEGMKPLLAKAISDARDRLFGQI